MTKIEKTERIQEIKELVQAEAICRDNARKLIRHLQGEESGMN